MTTPRADLIRRPGIVTLLAVLHFIAAALALAGGLGLIGASLAAVEEENTLLVIGIGALIAGVGLLQLVTGVGLWLLKPYGRTLQLILAAVGLLAIPIGTIICACILIYMCKPGIKALFSGKRPAELTPVELAEIARVTTGSHRATVLIVVLLALGSIIGVWILAAIEIPGLLRTRTAGNEVSADRARLVRALDSGDGRHYRGASPLDIQGSTCKSRPAAAP
jgi:hypothetical protein